MITETFEQSVLKNEALARKNAKIVLKQSQKLSLDDKKATAIDKTVLSIDKKLRQGDKHIDAMYGTMEKVIEGQDKLTTQSNELNISWNEMSQSQSDEAANIRQIKTALHQLTELKTATLSELQKIYKEQGENRATEIEDFNSKLLTLNEQLKTADNVDEIMMLETAINDTVDNIHRYKESLYKRALLINERIDKITRVTNSLTYVLSQYEDLLATMKTKVIYLSDMVDAADNRVSNLHHAGLDMTDADILKLFEDYIPDEVLIGTIEVGIKETKKIATKPAIEPEEEVNESEATQETQDEHNDEISESEIDVSKTKKRKWKFWKK